MLLSFLAQSPLNEVRLWKKDEPLDMVWALLGVAGLLVALVLWDVFRRRHEAGKQTKSLVRDVTACGLNEEERILVAELVSEFDIRQPSRLFDSLKVFDSYAQRLSHRILVGKGSWPEKQSRLKVLEGVRRKIMIHQGLDPLRSPESGALKGAETR